MCVFTGHVTFFWPKVITLTDLVFRSSQSWQRHYLAKANKWQKGYLSIATGSRAWGRGAKTGSSMLQFQCNFWSWSRSHPWTNASRGSRLESGRWNFGFLSLAFSMLASLKIKYLFIGGNVRLSRCTLRLPGNQYGVYFAFSPKSDGITSWNGWTDGWESWVVGRVSWRDCCLNK